MDMGSNMDTGGHMGTVDIEEGIEEDTEGTEVQGIDLGEKFGQWTVV